MRQEVVCGIDLRRNTGLDVPPGRALWALPLRRRRDRPSLHGGLAGVQLIHHGWNPSPSAPEAAPRDAREAHHMAKLIYSAITSLDGYVADEDGNFDWAAPDEEVHTFVNDLERPVGTYLYGRRMYEVMVYWETAHTVADQQPFVRDFAAIWQAADKIVYSTTLETVSSARTRVERDFDPEAIREMKGPAGRDITVEPRRPGDQGRLARRVAPVRHAYRGGRRRTVPPRRCPPGSRTAGRTPFRQRRGAPPLPHQDVRRRRRCQHGIEP